MSTGTIEAPPETTEERLEPFPEPQHAPGENGIATQEEEPEGYQPPEPTQDELKLADEVFRELNDDAREMGAERVIDALIQLVDVHKVFVTPELFGNRDDDEPKWEGAAVPAEIARLLCRGCPAIEAPFKNLVFYWIDHEKWTSNGQVVDGKVKRFDGFHRYRSEGVKAALIFNYHRWVHMNPRQKIYTVYHLLREIGSDGGTIAPHWRGYFDEPGLFGAGVHKEMVTMARAFVKDAPARANDPHQLSILDEVYD